MESKHTATPWKAKGTAAFSGNWEIYSSEDEKTITVVSGMSNPTSDEDAAFIVKACNNFEQLVASVQNLLDDLDALHTVDDLTLSVGRSRSWFSVLRANSLLDDIRTS